MNGAKFLFVIIILLYSCSAPRNIGSSQREDIDVSKTTLDNLKFDAASNFDFGSTKIQEIVFKRIEYFPPAESTSKCNITKYICKSTLLVLKN